MVFWRKMAVTIFVFTNDTASMNIYTAINNTRYLFLLSRSTSRFRISVVSSGFRDLFSNSFFRVCLMISDSSCFHTARRSAMRLRDRSLSHDYDNCIILTRLANENTYLSDQKHLYGRSDVSGRYYFSQRTISLYPTPCDNDIYLCFVRAR